METLFRDMYNVFVDSPILTILSGMALLVSGAFTTTIIRGFIKDLGLEGALIALLGAISVVILSALLGSVFMVLLGGA